MANTIYCLLVDDEPMAREILATYIAKIPNLELVDSCSNAMEALQIMNSNAIDLLFLDINMPEISGLSLAKSIQKQTKVIFTTAYREYAIDGFNLHAIDYLLKPIAFDRFLQAVNKYFEISMEQVSNSVSEDSKIKADFLFVRSDRKMIKIDFKDIQFIESLSDYIKIHTLNKIITSRETISNFEAKLPTTLFLRLHRSYIVNIKYIKSYTNEHIELENKALPISRSYKVSVVMKLEGK